MPEAFLVLFTYPFGIGQHGNITDPAQNCRFYP